MEGSGEFPAQAVAADTKSLLKIFQRVAFRIVFLEIRFHGQQIGGDGSGIPGDGQGRQYQLREHIGQLPVKLHLLCGSRGKGKFRQLLHPLGDAGTDGNRITTEKMNLKYAIIRREFPSA